jgi:hypothetical protein
MPEMVADKPHAETSPRDTLLRLIALLKFVKCGLLIFAGIVAIRMEEPDAAWGAERWTIGIARHYHVPALESAIRWVGQLNGKQMEALSLACFSYAALFLTEGIGLWKDRRWAEYLTILATGSLLPLEVFELTREVTVLRGLALIVNVLILAYLVRRLARTAHRP